MYEYVPTIWVEVVASCTDYFSLAMPMSQIYVFFKYSVTYITYQYMYGIYIGEKHHNIMLSGFRSQ